MEHVGLSPQRQADVLQAVAAVLHLGNIAFSDSAVQDDTSGSSGHDAAAVAGPSSERALAVAAELLAVEPEQLRAALTTRLITTPEGARPVTAGCTC